MFIQPWINKIFNFFFIFENAFDFRWIEQKEFEDFQPFYELSVGASDPDKNDSDVSSVSLFLSSPPPVGIVAAGFSEPPPVVERT